MLRANVMHSNTSDNTSPSTLWTLMCSSSASHEQRSWHQHLHEAWVTVT